MSPFQNCKISYVCRGNGESGSDQFNFRSNRFHVTPLDHSSKQTDPEEVIYFMKTFSESRLFEIFHCRQSVSRGIGSFAIGQGGRRR